MLLADTLYRVPRDSGLHVVQRRGPGQAQWLTSRRLIVEPGGRASFRSADEWAEVFKGRDLSIAHAETYRPMWPSLKTYPHSLFVLDR